MLKRLSEALHIKASWYRLLLLLALSLFFINVGVDHFINPDFYLNIMPDYLPFHAEAVYLSGFFEILGGIVVLIPKLRALARWGLISLLIAVFPANIYMAMNPNLFPEFSLALLYFRLPLQFLFIFWVLKATEMVRD
tara:strand:+ start:39 stop:449 length:411 start_codon:yes stop_codon:yes gene_type:complete